MQTGVADVVPVICISKKYWKGLFDWLEENPLTNDFFIHKISDLNLIHFADTTGEVLEIINKN